MFINFCVTKGLSINTFTQPNGWYNSDVSGLIDDIIYEHNGCCPLEGALEILEEDRWQGSNATAEIIEHLAELIKEYNHE